MTALYYETMSMIERLHRQFMDVIKIELERAGILDINNVQCLILHNIGIDELTVGELTVRGYYLGSNVSYNIKKMVENGYLVQERSVHDKRSVRVKLSEKGRKLDAAVGALYTRHAAALSAAGISQTEIEKINRTLHNLETFLSGQTGNGILSNVS